jgi:predicted short-subunit dehydrogenase-like oxidoreductase (DUF2520 family)
MKVVIIGAGNVASVLGRKISQAGHEIVQVVGRNAERVTDLAAELKSKATIVLSEIDSQADIYIISIADQAVKEAASYLNVNNGIVVHTAAGVSKEVLASISENYGVLYPLQTLRKEMSVIPKIPVILDGSNVFTIETLWTFATGWADSVSFADDEERLRLHVAAVVVSNFPNHLFALAEEYCEKNGLKFNRLMPLIEETISRVKYGPVFRLQTGPAVRSDFVTIARHQQVLEMEPGLLKVYNLLTDSIVSFYSDNKR